jgi:competence protein ComEA
MNYGVVLTFLITLLLVAHPASAAAPAPGAAIAGKQVVALDLNKAGKEELLAVPGIGPKMAQSILDLRARKGSFTRVEDLLEVRGIGEKNLVALAPYLTVVPAAAPAPAKPPEKK